MNVKKYIWPSKRLYRLPIIFFGVVILYTLLGFFLLPKIIQYKTATTFTELLDRKTQIEQVHFNPYNFACKIDDLSVKTKEGQENWMTVESILVNLQSVSLLHQAIILSQIQIEHPRLSITRYSDNTYNFSDLLKKQTGSEHDEKSESPLRFSLNNIDIQAGEVEFIDEPMQTRHQVSKINFRLPSLSNFPVEVNTHIKPYFSAKVNNMSFELDGRTKPFAKSRQTEFDVVIDNVSLPHYLSYLPGERNFSLTRGELSSNLTITYAQPIEKATYLKIGGGVKLNNLQVINSKATNEDHELCVIPRLNMELSGGNLLAGELNIAKVHIKEPRINVVRLQNGTLSFPDIGKETETSNNMGASSSGQTGKSPFSLSMDHFQLESGKISYTDNSTSPSFTTNVSNISCNLNNLSTTRSEAKGSLKASMRIGKQGQLKAKGELGFSPLTARIDMGLEDIDLTNFEPFIKDHVDLTMQNGIFDAQGIFDIQGSSKGEAPGLSFQGQAGVIDLKVAETKKNSDFLSWDRLNLEDIEFESLQPTLSIKRVELVGLNNQIIIYEDGSSNVESIFKTQARTERPPTTNEEQDSKVFAVDEFQLSRSNLRLMDKTVSPVFHHNLENLQCTVKGITNQNEHPADISLQTNFGRSATLQLDGKAKFLGEEFFTDMEIDLVNIALSPFSPYSGKYIGYAIQKGKLNLESQVQIKGRKLECDNKLLLDQFALGQKVDSPRAVDAPIKLGIALLKNRDGEININKKVSGNLSNPKFSVGDLVMKVFTNVLVTAATSPYTLISSMFGSGEEDINFVLFSPGKINLSQKAKNKMQVIGKALYERPELQVNILGRADTSSDKAALQRKHFRNILKQQKLLDMKEEEQSKTDLQDISISQEEYPTYLWQAYKSSQFEKPQKDDGMTKKLPLEVMEQNLKKHIVITKDDLKQLAIDRATEVINFLHQVASVESKRIFLHNTKIGTAQDKEFRKVTIRLN